MMWGAWGPECLQSLKVVLIPLNLGINVVWCVPAIKCQHGDLNTCFSPIIFFNILQFDPEAQLCPLSWV